MSAWIGWVAMGVFIGVMVDSFIDSIRGMMTFNVVKFFVFAIAGGVVGLLVYLFWVMG
jgi:hypothetical protein